MNSRTTSIGVVLATTGHERLEFVLKSIFSQVSSLDKVVIVDNSPKGVYERISKIETTSNVKILRKEDQTGAADAYNLGLKDNTLDTVDFIAIASDDDVWQPSKIEFQLAKADVNKIIIGKAIYTLKNKKEGRIRPNRLKSQNEGILEYLYGNKPVLKNSRYLPAASILFPRGLKHLEFRRNSKIREDILWLHEAELLEYRIEQIDKILVEVWVDLEKDANRANVYQAIEFADKLPPNLANNFLFFHAMRSTVASGMTNKIVEFYLELRRRKYNIWKYLPTIFIQIVMSTTYRLSQKWSNKTWASL